MNFFAILLFAPYMAFASPPTINLSEHLRCAALLNPAKQENIESVQKILADALPPVVSGSPIDAQIGVLSELPVLMKTSGAKSHAILMATGAISAVLAANVGQDTVLGNVALRLNRFQSEETKLLICVLSKDCRLRYGSALHLAINTEFNIVPFAKVDGENTKLGWLSGEGTLTAAPPRIIVMNGGPNPEAALWATRFLHEATHFADFELVGEWIQANLARLKNQAMPDELFTGYARVGDGGKIEIDEGFLRIFLESRAYAAEMGGFSRMVPARYFKQMQREQRRHAMDDIRAFNPVTYSLVQRLNLSEQNVFEIGERFGRMMTETIRKSN